MSGAYLRHLQRVTKRGDFVPFTKTVKALIQDLANLSLSQYSEVRQYAQSRRLCVCVCVVRGVW